MILGGGMTGLAAGYRSGIPVYEAREFPGGICSSYYVRPSGERLGHAPDDGQAYRFEIGGGHWIFGGDPSLHAWLKSLTPARSYTRRSAVYFPDSKRHVPYPLQFNLRHLSPETASKALKEITAPRTDEVRTDSMADWLVDQFGPTLCGLFFRPFHDLYTAGLTERIAPQDPYKSPVDRKRVIDGASRDVEPAGYNRTFVYPTEGLDTLARKMAAECSIQYRKQVEQIDVAARRVRFADGTQVGYERLISTLPLNLMINLTSLQVDVPAPPSNGVLVLNIGAERGPNCPDDHWLYVPRSDSGFHRVGFYSNVDPAFLPESGRNRVAIYVEKACSARPIDTKALEESVVRELQGWGWIGEAEVVDPTWIEVAYTWSLPGAIWQGRAQAKLAEHGIHQVGRYARWVFQGIADSIRDGFVAGRAFEPCPNRALRP